MPRSHASNTTCASTGEAIAGRALLTIDVLREGWVKVPIPAGLMVRDARLDGQPVSLIEGPPAHVVLSRPGRAVLSLEISLPLASSAGTESIALPSSAAPLSRAVLTLPRGGVELTVTGGFISERSESATESRWTALGRANQPLGFSWKRKVDDRRAEQALRFRARVTSVIGLGEEVSAISAVVRAEVQQGMARELSLAIPAGLVINQVNGATVADWDVTAGLLRVRFLDPVTIEVSFVVQGEGRLPAAGEVTVPLVRVPAAERETGGVAISVLGAGEIEKHQMRGLEPADVSDFADVVAGRESPSMVAFRLRPIGGADPRGLNVVVKRYTPQAVLIANVEEARYRALIAEDGLLLVEAHYALRNNQRSFLKITLPPGRHDLERVGGGQTRASRRCGKRRGAARSREGSRRRRRADVSGANHLPPIHRTMDRQGTRCLDSPGTRSADLPDGRRAVSLAAFSGRAATRRVSNRFRSRRVCGGAARRAARG